MVELSILSIILLVIIGILIGIIASMVGIGGGVIIIPVLMFFYGLSNPMASAVSSLVIVATSTTGTLTYYRQHRIDLRTGVYFGLIAIPSAFIGGILADTLREEILTILFGLFLNIIAFRKIINILTANSNTNQKVLSIFDKNTGDSYVKTSYGLFPHRYEKRIIVDDLGEYFSYNVQLVKILVGAALGGLISGIFGVGGGVIYVPVLASIGGLPLHIAVATSTFTILLSSSSSSVARIIGGKILWEFVLFLGIGTVIGARIGATKVRKISNEKILGLFYIIVFLSGIRIILSGLGIF